MATATAEDVCDGTLVVTPIEMRIDSTCGYRLERTWTATDACGNEVVGRQTIIVQDTEAPIFTNIPIDLTVNLNNGDYLNQSQLESEGVYIFNVDCYASAKSDTSESGDKKATLKLQKLLGSCRAILENSQYKTLGFATPFISNRHIQSITISEPGRQDALSTVMGRLQMSVRVNELSEVKDADTLTDFLTTVKLFETEKGYFFQAANANNSFDYNLEIVL